MNEIIIFAWHFFRDNIRYISLLSAPFALLAFPSYFISQTPENRNAYITTFALILYVTGISIFMSSLIFFMSQKYQENVQSIKSNLINGVVYAPLLMLTLLIANSPFIAAAVIMFTSMSLYFLTLPLIIVGIYVSLKSTFAPFHLILEGNKPLDSIKTSFIATKGKVAKIVMVLIAFYIATTVVDVFSTLNTKIELFNILVFFIGVAVTMLMVAFQQIAVFKIYISSFENTK